GELHHQLGARPFDGSLVRRRQVLHRRPVASRSPVIAAPAGTAPQACSGMSAGSGGDANVSNAVTTQPVCRPFKEFVLIIVLFCVQRPAVWADSVGASTSRPCRRGGLRRVGLDVRAPCHASPRSRAAPGPSPRTGAAPCAAAPRASPPCRSARGESRAGR